MELLVLLVFCLLLILCIATGLSILYALTAGLFLFVGFSLWKGFRPKEVCAMCLEGIKTVKNILITFILIGMMTGLWRAAGTIPSIVCYSVHLITPSIFLLLTFLLNCLVSFLTGTALGTAATMGTVCMTMGLALQMDPLFMGGAILAGSYFGDRCSPVSTSALLVAELTDTSIFVNIPRMVKSSLVPFGISCLIYLGAGFLLPHSTGQLMDVEGIFSVCFKLGLLPLLPAVAILVLALCKISVKKTMAVSIVLALLIAIFYQEVPLQELLQIILTGYQSSDAQVAAMLNGGGLTSMIRVGCIVCLSSSYSGIFRKTGLLDLLQEMILRLSKKATSFAVTLPTAILLAMVSCNQALTIMLSHQLCSPTEKDQARFAIDLENSAVVIAPLVPWSVACALPLTTIGAPSAAVLGACYLYLLPLWTLLSSFAGRKKQNSLN